MLIFTHLPMFCFPACVIGNQWYGINKVSKCDLRIIIARYSKACFVKDKTC